MEIQCYRVKGLDKSKPGYVPWMAFYAMDDAGAIYLDARVLDRMSMWSAMFDEALKLFDGGNAGAPETLGVVPVDWLIENVDPRWAIHKERLAVIHNKSGHGYP